MEIGPEGRIYYFLGASGEGDGEEEEEEILVEETTVYDIDDIYEELLTCSSRLYSVASTSQDIEARTQRLETYFSVTVGLLSFILGAIMGYLFLGRILS
jgi:hypothetical protein